MAEYIGKRTEHALDDQISYTPFRERCDNKKNECDGKKRILVNISCQIYVFFA